MSCWIVVSQQFISLSCHVCFIPLALQWRVPWLWEWGCFWLRPDQDLGELYALIPDLGCSLKLPFFQTRFEALDQPPAAGTWKNVWLQTWTIKSAFGLNVQWSFPWFSYWHILSLIASNAFGDRFVLSGRISQEQGWIYLTTRYSSSEPLQASRLPCSHSGGSRAGSDAPECNFGFRTETSQWWEVMPLKGKIVGNKNITKTTASTLPWQADVRALNGGAMSPEMWLPRRKQSPGLL